MLVALAAELTASVDYVNEVKTLYFGGGTPSVCSPLQIGELIELVCRLWNVTQFDELTLEANPEDLTLDYLRDLRAVGVDRLSIGIQSFDDHHLQQMNRSHSGEQAQAAVERARAVGFSNISIDLIYGLPFMTIQEWARNIERALELRVEHISSYHLTIEPRTVFGKRGLRPIDDDVSQEHYLMLDRSLSEAGYDHYEISNFALPGYYARHNSSYWDGTPYLGVGPSAHSFNGLERRWNVSSNKLYLQGALPDVESLSSRDRFNEVIMTSLRTSRGVDLSAISTPGGLMSRASRFLTSGDLVLDGGYLRIPTERFLISDYIISELFE